LRAPAAERQSADGERETHSDERSRTPPLPRAHRPSSLPLSLPPQQNPKQDVIAARGLGSYVWTTTGERYLDFTSGIGATSTGHCHPRVVAAVREQAGQIAHAQQNIFGGHTALEKFVEQMNHSFPKDLQHYFLCNSGSEAVDNAVKIARAATGGRPNVVCFEGGFHGRTIGAMSLTTSKVVYRQGMGPGIPGVHVVPYPYCLHCKWQGEVGMRGYPLEPACAPFFSSDGGAAASSSSSSSSPSPARECCNAYSDALDMLFSTATHPKETAAVIVEPVLGEGGFLTPPPGFMKKLRQLADRHGFLLIADEVQSGAGRTGRWWGHQHFDEEAMQPDLMVFAKGVASGYPMAGVAAREGIFERLPGGTLGGTYGGNAVACAAGAATLRAIREEGMVENAAKMGARLQVGLVELAKRHGSIVDVRGRGLMVGIEFGKEEEEAAAGGGSGKKRGNPGRCSPSGAAGAVARAAAKRGVLLMPAGAREAMRFLPPLNVSAEEVDACLEATDAALAEVFG
jgi:4-aminobutyrate aminotransferase